MNEMKVYYSDLQKYNKILQLEKLREEEMRRKEFLERERIEEMKLKELEEKRRMEMNSRAGSGKRGIITEETDMAALYFHGVG